MLNTGEQTLDSVLSRNEADIFLNTGKPSKKAVNGRKRENSASQLQDNRQECLNSIRRLR
jgi:hypothetical protein